MIETFHICYSRLNVGATWTSKRYTWVYKNIHGLLCKLQEVRLNSIKYCFNGQNWSRKRRKQCKVIYVNMHMWMYTVADQWHWSNILAMFPHSWLQLNNCCSLTLVVLHSHCNLTEECGRVTQAMGSWLAVEGWLACKTCYTKICAQSLNINLNYLKW